MALKRQQAAEDAIALSMAKVATGQKLDRLPPGKIFGMAVTEPNPTSLSTSSSITTESSVSEEKESSISGKDGETEVEVASMTSEITTSQTTVQSPVVIFYAINIVYFPVYIS